MPRGGDYRFRTLEIVRARFSGAECRSAFNFYNIYPIPMHLGRLERSLYGGHNSIFGDLNVKELITLQRIEIRIEIKIGRI
jgi:hypothetical protein